MRRAYTTCEHIWQMVGRVQNPTPRPSEMMWRHNDEPRNKNWTILSKCKKQDPETTDHVCWDPADPNNPHTCWGVSSIRPAHWRDNKSLKHGSVNMCKNRRRRHRDTTSNKNWFQPWCYDDASSTITRDETVQKNTEFCWIRTGTSFNLTTRLDHSPQRHLLPR